MRYARFRLLTRALAWAGCLLMLPTAATTVEASPESRRMTREAYDLAYDLRLTESLGLLAQARTADPSDPAPPRALAGLTWLQTLCAQGVATFAAFEGTATGDVVARPAVPESLRTRFYTEIEQAIALAEDARRLGRDAIDAQYQLGASLGLRALYRGSVEGRAFAALNDGRKAVSLLEDLRRRVPQHHEAALLPGIYRYAVSTLSLPKRWIAAAAGLPGDRAGGIALLEHSARDNAATSTDASIVLMIVYNREGRRLDALRHIRAVHQRHPMNRLLSLNLAATELAAGNGAAAARALDETLSRMPALDQPSIPGERALWLYTRGAARLLLGDAAAKADLQQALDAQPREWVRARVHVELAKLAIASGARKNAAAELDQAVRHARRAGDQTALAMAQSLRAMRVDP